MGWRVIIALTAALALAVAAIGGASAQLARSPGADTGPGAAICLTQAPTNLEVNYALAVTDARLTGDTQALRPGRFPAVSDRSGVWRTSPASSWTSGFFPGSLWLMGHATGQAGLLHSASMWTAALTGQAVQTVSHDIGFQILTSFGNGYEVNHNDAYRRVILEAASTLATRYDRAVGAIRSWGPRGDHAHFLVIVDGLMNNALLFWGARHGGDPAWAQMALRDALTVREHFIRPDGSLVHLVNFDPATGAVISKSNPQAYDRTSTWSRGQAWAIAGFAIAYRETHDPRMLEAARRASAYFLGHLPSDCVPYWDFDAPGIPVAPRDSSAAAIAADGLLFLSQLDPDATRRSADLQAAAALLDALIVNDLAPQGQAVLAHGTPDKRTGVYNVATSYGDYYFLDALLRYRRALTG